MSEFFNHIFTARDGLSYSLTKLVGIAGAVAMVYNFVSKGSTDFNGFGIGIAALMAALAVKYAVEQAEK